jgi:hypothetical protein
MGFQNGVERDLILTNKRTSTLLLVPILGKGENLLDAYDEKARFPVMLSICSFMSSSYLLDAKAPRGGRGFFSFQPGKPTKRAAQTLHPRKPTQPPSLPPPVHLSRARQFLRDYLEKKRADVHPLP